MFCDYFGGDELVAVGVGVVGAGDVGCGVLGEVEGGGGEVGE